jgi:tetratricopeptide (TPR) repeat protein
MMGRVREARGQYEEALAAFEKCAQLQSSARSFGEVRAIRIRFTKEEHIEGSLSEEMRLSRLAYELDPEGKLNPKNLSDFGYDLYKVGRRLAGQERERTLQKAYKILIQASEAYSSSGYIHESNFPLWFAGECFSELIGKLDETALSLLVKAARIQGTPRATEKLCGRMRDLPRDRARVCDANFAERLLERPEPGPRADSRQSNPSCARAVCGTA